MIRRLIVCHLHGYVSCSENGLIQWTDTFRLGQADVRVFEQRIEDRRVAPEAEEDFLTQLSEVVVIWMIWPPHRRDLRRAQTKF